KRFGEQQSEVAVELVDAFECVDARVVLRDARAVVETGLAAVAGARIDPAQPMSHRLASSKRRRHCSNALAGAACCARVCSAMQPRASRPPRACNRLIVRARLQWRVTREGVIESGA